MAYRVNFKSGTRKKSKYNNKTQEYNGLRYDSIKEAQYAEELDWRVKAGEVERWERQVKVDLRVNGVHIANYFCDFKVWLTDGTIQYHEVKGFETDVWRMKWRIFHATLNEIEPGAELIVIK